MGKKQRRESAIKYAARTNTFVCESDKSSLSNLNLWVVKQYKSRDGLNNTADKVLRKAVFKAAS